MPEPIAAYTCTSCGFATVLCVCSDGPRDPETGHTTSAAQDQRDPACVERWPECESGAYEPRCCRFPKECACTSYPPDESPAAQGRHSCEIVHDDACDCLICEEHFQREDAEVRALSEEDDHVVT